MNKLLNFNKIHCCFKLKQNFISIDPFEINDSESALAGQLRHKNRQQETFEIIG